MTERRHLPDVRQSITRKFKLNKPPRANACPKCGHTWVESGEVKVYANIGFYEDGTPGELFITVDRVGSTAHGALDAAAMAISVGLQYGVPIEAYLSKLVGMKFGADGYTGDATYPKAGSVLDIVARWIRDVIARQAK